MKLSAAPLIHARTLNIDFRDNFLVIPSQFSDSDIRQAKKHVLNSTAFFEKAGTGGRRVIFRTGEKIVSGISINIEDLYRKCGRQPKYHRVENSRINYAFIGFVFYGDSFSQIFDIPDAMYLEQFETYMALRWMDSMDDPQAFRQTVVEPMELEFPAAQSVSKGIKMPGPGQTAVLDAHMDTGDAIAAAMLSFAQKHADFAFCSDAPYAIFVEESDFKIVTATNAAAIRGKLQNSAPAPTSAPAREAVEAEKKPRNPVALPAILAAAVLLLILIFLLCK